MKSQTSNTNCLTRVSLLTGLWENLLGLLHKLLAHYVVCAMCPNTFFLNIVSRCVEVIHTHFKVKFCFVWRRTLKNFNSVLKFHFWFSSINVIDHVI